MSATTTKTLMKKLEGEIYNGQGCASSVSGFVFDGLGISRWSGFYSIGLSSLYFLVSRRFDCSTGPLWILCRACEVNFKHIIVDRVHGQKRFTHTRSAPSHKSSTLQKRQPCAPALPHPCLGARASPAHPLRSPSPALAPSRTRSHITSLLSFYAFAK